ncbi:MAG: hypothetical protein COB51_05625 [Moraxellaceae bacterium]|nr:MAG: hypothetical protein COB51_05625 [Moraxellaceae bacterium]
MMRFVRSLLFISIAGYILILLLMSLMMSGDVPSQLASVQSLLLYLPYWLMYLPLLVAVPLSIWVSKPLSLLLALVAILNALQIFDLYAWNASAEDKTKLPGQLRVLTFNQGGTPKSDLLRQYAEKMQVDVMLFQESHRRKVPKMSEAGWQRSCQLRLCVVSRYPFRIEERIKRPRKNSGDYAGISYKFKLRIDSQGVQPKDSQEEGGKDIVLNLYNVHFDTPRKALESVIELNEQTGVMIEENFGDRRRESKQISELAKAQRYSLIAGDFNLVTNDPLYSKYWRGFKNTYSEAGVGFGSTKYTRWHGVRIDHILTSPNITVHQAWVGPDLGGDHRPVIADIAFPLAFPIAFPTPRDD